MNRRTILLFIAILLVMFVCSSSVLAQGNAPQPSSKSQPIDPQVEKDKRYAIELYDNGDKIGALPWFEKVASALPQDADVLEKLAVCIHANAAGLKTPEERKAERLRARKIMLRARELGDNSNMVKIMLDDTPEDGSEVEFSEIKGVDEAMRRGEQAFSAHKLEEAKAAYLQALLIDPKEYHAALFIGDVYFSKKEYGAACEWFSRTASIDPQKETAYRYWADALMMMGKYSEGRQKYIEAVVADPYNQKVWMGVNKFAKFTGSDITWYKFKPASGYEVKDDKNVTITLDPAAMDKKDGSSAWLVYGMERALWHSEKFAKEYPNEKDYRHSLKEEASALGLVATVALESTKEKKLNDDLKALVKLQKAGFIEAYVLLNGSDKDIAKDYVDYREKHRDVIIKYLSEIVLPPAPKDKE
jgi:tetratricopeptide (TPR) repeat protein